MYPVFYPVVRVSVCWFNIWRHLNTRVVVDSSKDINAGDGLGPNAGSHSPSGGFTDQNPAEVFYGSDVGAGAFPEEWPTDLMAELSDTEKERPKASYWTFTNLDRYALDENTGEKELDVLIRFSAEWKTVEESDNPDNWADLGYHSIGYVYFIAEVTRYTEDHPEGVRSIKWIKSYVSSDGRPAGTRRVSLQVHLDGFYDWMEDYGGVP